MTERILVLLILYSVIIIIDLPHMRRQQVRERMLYSALMLVTLYLAVDYAIEANWPNLNKLLDIIFGSTTKQIVEYFK